MSLSAVANSFFHGPGRFKSIGTPDSPVATEGQCDLTHAYLLETGRVVISGTAESIRNDESVRRSYLGY